MCHKARIRLRCLFILAIICYFSKANVKEFLSFFSHVTHIYKIECGKKYILLDWNAQLDTWILYMSMSLFLLQYKQQICLCATEYRNVSNLLFAPLIEFFYTMQLMYIKPEWRDLLHFCTDRVYDLFCIWENTELFFIIREWHCSLGFKYVYFQSSTYILTQI